MRLFTHKIQNLFGAHTKTFGGPRAACRLKTPGLADAKSTYKISLNGNYEVDYPKLMAPDLHPSNTLRSSLF
jgi:hypothetical protein